MGEFRKCIVFDLKDSLGQIFLRFDCNLAFLANKWCNLCSSCCLSLKNYSH